MDETRRHRLVARRRSSFTGRFLSETQIRHGPYGAWFGCYYAPRCFRSDRAPLDWPKRQLRDSKRMGQPRLALTVQCWAESLFFCFARDDMARFDDDDDDRPRRRRSRDDDDDDYPSRSRRRDDDDDDLPPRRAKKKSNL